MIVTICGSMRFFDQMLQVAADETAKGNIVLVPFPVADDQVGGLRGMLDRLHFEKIDMAEQVVVVTNQYGYIGVSTRNEMDYAIRSDKSVDVRKFQLSEPTPS